jgi:hypothetical protein
MVTVMQAVQCVSWEPLSGQDMRLVWRRRSIRNHKEVSTSLFRKSLRVRMRISSLINNPTLAISAGRLSHLRFLQQGRRGAQGASLVLHHGWRHGPSPIQLPKCSIERRQNHLILFSGSAVNFEEMLQAWKCHNSSM